jgi:pSer/pThr/pTyr-binding forkhead associated (FHA) protein
MKNPPVMVVQLIHIQGPLKGEIFTFSERRTSGRGLVSIGRHPSCHLRFPLHLTSVSRKHAEIIREGNEFKLVDHSANGTFLNGKRIKETYLKNGDVLEFSEGGPKVSFLVEMMEGEAGVESLAPPPRLNEKQRISVNQDPPMRPREAEKTGSKKPEMVQPEVSEPRFERPQEIAGQSVQVPLVIQYGPTLRSYKELPIILGKSPKCHFIIDHPAIFDQHAQFFFSQNQYWIKDLTGQGAVLINRVPIPLQAPLKPNDHVSLSPRGPIFRFLGEGRLAEIAESPAEESLKPSEKKGEAERQVQKGKGLKSVFKKLLEH